MLRYCNGFRRSTSFGGGVADDCGRCAGTAEAEMVRASTRRRTKLMRDARNVWNIRMAPLLCHLKKKAWGWKYSRIEPQMNTDEHRSEQGDTVLTKSESSSYSSSRKAKVAHTLHENESS